MVSLCLCGEIASTLRHSFLRPATGRLLAEKLVDELFHLGFHARPIANPHSANHAVAIQQHAGGITIETNDLIDSGERRATGIVVGGQVEVQPF